MKTPLILYSTYGCHLCEVALELCLAAPAGEHFTLREVDIFGDDELEERYGVRIPVLRDPASGQELGWPFDHAQLDEFLRGLA